MENLTAEHAREITKNALLFTQKQDREEFKKTLEHYIDSINQNIKKTAEQSETYIELVIQWNDKFNIPIKKHYKHLGYYIHLQNKTCHDQIIGYHVIKYRCVRISWNPNPFKRFLEIFF